MRMTGLKMTGLRCSPVLKRDKQQKEKAVKITRFLFVAVIVPCRNSGIYQAIQRNRGRESGVWMRQVLGGFFLAKTSCDFTS